MKRIAIILALLASPAMAQNQSQRGMAQRYHLRDCMVELCTIKDEGLRKWCEAQSKRMP